MGVQALNQVLLGASYGAYVVLLQSEYGWSKTIFSGAYSMQQVESGIFGPLQGFLIDKFGPRTVMRVGVVLFSAGFMLFSRIESVATFYAVFLLMSIGSSLSGFFPITVTVVNWFVRRRASALGMVSAGMGIGGILAPITAVMLSEFGWRATAFGSGIVILAVGLPLTQLMRRRPEDHGLLPDGADHVEQTAATPTISATPNLNGEREFSARQALATRAFWFISLGHASALLVVSAVQVHLLVFLKESLGFSVREGATVFALLTASSMVGQLGGGFLGDRISKRVIVTLCMSGHMIALLTLAYASELWQVVVFAVVHGLSWGTRGPLMAAIRADYFGRSSFGAISGYASMVIMAGTVSGPLVAGIMADQLGNYRAGFTVLALLAGLGSVFWLVLRPPHTPASGSSLDGATG